MIYFVTARDIGRVKIGYSETPRLRFVKMRTDSPVPLELERVCEGATSDERALHERFAADRLEGEWFTLSAEIEAHMRFLDPVLTVAKRPSVSQMIMRATGFSPAYASQLNTGAREFPIPVAISVFEMFGAKVGPIAEATDHEIAVLAKFCGRSA